MRIVALLTVRNEERFLPTCLSHLSMHGIEVCVIDNESTDGTREIAEAFRGRSVIRIETLPFNGCFELEAQLKSQERLASEIDADWFIHHDADEVMESADNINRLYGAIEEVDRAGYNAINFDEFVFVPLKGESFEDGSHYYDMKHYYFFEPYPVRLVRAWKASARPVLSKSGGHDAAFEGRKLYPENFVLRHYIALSEAHVLEKYTKQRKYSSAETPRWHGWRPHVRPDVVRLPDPSRLKTLGGLGEWDRSQPEKEHLFIAHELLR